ncbi:MAG: phosphoribosyltransferase family protein [Ruminococcus flavefaciens]|nr:phosphoribosyltransferase family protein [Ruminococcus flavefaciens]MCM1231073.1 phosphoribosyltransferase family protein [Ruminococcus flavefaciens]
MNNINEFIRIGKRYNNKKRSYLLVNALQAKHIPTRPQDITLGADLGRKIRAEYPEAHFVIGFAETATAIASSVAWEVGTPAEEACDCQGIYINTTREDSVPDGDCICFQEEHSHAVNQKLYVKNFTKYLGYTKEIILVDDEISTGKTLFNIIKEMRAEIPELAERDFVVGSVINRLTPERAEFFRQHRIYFVSLYDVQWTDEMLEKDFANLSAPAEISDIPDKSPDFMRIAIPDSRYFVNALEYNLECGKIADVIAENVDFSGCKDVLFLGTEECMYPSILTAGLLEKRFGFNAYCHSTTRSPVCISDEEGYPMQNGYRICSLYDIDRVNYIYNLRRYDMAVVISDAKNPDPRALAMLDTVLAENDIEKRFYFMG